MKQLFLLSILWPLSACFSPADEWVVEGKKAYSVGESCEKDPCQNLSQIKGQLHQKYTQNFLNLIFSLIEKQEIKKDEGDYNTSQPILNAMSGRVKKIEIVFDASIPGKTWNSRQLLYLAGSKMPIEKLDAENKVLHALYTSVAKKNAKTRAAPSILRFKNRIEVSAHDMAYRMGETEKYPCIAFAKMETQDEEILEYFDRIFSD